MKIKDGEWIIIRSYPDHIRLWIGGKTGEREFNLTLVEAVELGLELQQAVYRTGKT